MGNKNYLKQPWISPKAEVKNSPTHGLGLFAKESIKEGEVAVIWGGNFVNEVEAQKAERQGKAVQKIDDDLFDVFDYDKRHDDPTYNHNHSCNPNTWMKDEVAIIAKHDIEPGEELTIDYAMFVIDDEYVLPGDCQCDSPLCRHTITGKDWRRKDLQEKYRGHFSPFLKRQIAKLV